MSASKWSYSSEKCDGDFCFGDCDICPKAYDDLDIEMESENGTTYIPEGRCELPDFPALLSLLQ